MTDNVAVELLSKPWQKFLIKCKECEKLSVDKWNEYQALGYFLKRFEDHFKRQFALSYKNAPSKCSEFYMMKRTIVMLNTKDFSMVKDYIDWLFDKKIIPNKMQIRSMAIAATPSFANEFLYRQSKINKVTKSMMLPESYKKKAEELNIPVSTYGDLAFAKMAMDRSPDNKAYDKYYELFNNLIEIGFKPSMLEGL